MPKQVTKPCRDCGKLMTRAPQARVCVACRKHDPRKVIYLRAGQSVPQRPPDARYVGEHGYVRVRWKVGRTTYLEAYEHRLVAGATDDGEMQVHHINRDRADNRPENLRVVTTEQHGVHHGDGSRRVYDWSLFRELYEDGFNLKQVGRLTGADPATVRTALLKSGIQIRSKG